MPDDLKLRAVIESILQAKGFNELDAALVRTKTHAGVLKKSADDLGYSFSTLKTAFLGVAGATAVVELLRSSYVDFARTERQFNAIAGQLRAMGDESGLMARQVRDFINAVSEQTGILDDDLIPAYNRLLLGTKDVKAAQELLQIASRFAANGFGTVEANAERLTVAIQRGTVRSLAEFGVVTDDLVGKQDALSIALDRVREKANTLNPSLNDAQDRLNRLARAWDTVKDSIGFVIDKLLQFEPSVRRAMAALELLSGSSEVKLSKTLQLESAKRIALHREEQEKAISSANKSGEERAAATKRWSDQIARELSRAIDREESDETSANRRKLDAIKQAGEDDLRIQHDQIEARLELAQSGGQEELRDRMLLLANELRAETANERLTAEQKLRILETYRLRADGILDRWVNDNFRANDRIVKDEKKTAAARIVIEKAVTKTKTEFYEEAAAQSLSILSSLFGKNKALAFNEAGINTALAATRAYRDYPYPANIIVMALTIAAGVAQQYKIATADQGFDDPRSDMEARLGGRRWAKDMVREFSGGASAGWAEGLRSGRASIVNNSSSSTFSPVNNTTVNISGFVGSGRTEMLTRLQRELDLVNRTKLRRGRIGGGGLTGA